MLRRIQQTVAPLRRGLLTLAIVSPSIVAGCAILNPKPLREYTTVSADSSDTMMARELNGKGVHQWRKGNYEKAEKFYRDALIADVNFGPAHNNLGHLYLSKSELYTAAWEFDLAATAMPGRVEPIINLGLVYEQARRWDQAEAYYRQAYEMNPQSPDAVGHLARILVRTESDKFEINLLLHELLMVESRTDWRVWAEELLETRYHGTPIDSVSDSVSAAPAEAERPIPSNGPPFDRDIHGPLRNSGELPEPLPANSPEPLQLVPPFDLGRKLQDADISQVSATLETGEETRSEIRLSALPPPQSESSPASNISDAAAPAYPRLPSLLKFPPMPVVK